MFLNPKTTVAKLNNLNFIEEAEHFQKLLPKSQNVGISQQIPIFSKFKTFEPQNDFAQNFKAMLQLKRRQSVSNYMVRPTDIFIFESAFHYRRYVSYASTDWETIRKNINEKQKLYLEESFLAFFRNGDKFRAVEYLDCLRLISRLLSAYQYLDSDGIRYNGIISEKKIHKFIELMIPNIYGLNRMGPHREYYVPYAASIFMSFLSSFDDNKVLFKDFVISRPFVQFVNLEFESDKNPFRLEKSQKVYNLFLELDKKKVGYLYKSDVKDMDGFSFTDAFIDRLFDHGLIMTSTENGRLDYTLFLSLCAAVNYPKHAKSIGLFFQIADIDGDGAIGNFDILYFYKSMIAETKLNNHSYDTFFCELLDITNSSDVITKKQIMKSKTSDPLFFLLFDKNTFRKWEEKVD